MVMFTPLPILFSFAYITTPEINEVKKTLSVPGKCHYQIMLPYGATKLSSCTLKNLNALFPWEFIVGKLPV